MKAMIVTELGNPGKFEMQNVEKPTPGPGEVLVKVHATSVNPADVGLRSGMFGPMIKPPLTLGLDISGVIEAVGPGVIDFAPGDAVYYALHPMDREGGGNSEYHVEKTTRIAHKPENLTHIEAAALPVVGATAYESLIIDAGLRLGDTVLVHGAAGGVGSIAVQIAVAAGAYVFATCGSYDIDTVKELGAHRVLDYTDENLFDVVRQEVGTVDIVFDTSGKMLTKSFPVLRSGGSGIVIAGVQGNINEAMHGGKSVAVYFAHPQNTRAALQKLAMLAERGQIKPLIGKTLPLAQLPEAHQLVEQGGSNIHGKVVVEVAAS